jgi:hypothetical protein
VGTPFDDPDHPYGQWTVKLTKVVPNVAASVDSVMVTAQFLVDAAPLERLIPGMRLGLFYGVTTLGELVVIDVASWFKGDADGKG